MKKNSKVILNKKELERIRTIIERKLNVPEGFINNLFKRTEEEKKKNPQKRKRRSDKLTSKCMSVYFYILYYVYNYDTKSISKNTGIVETTIRYNINRIFKKNDDIELAKNIIEEIKK